MPNNVRLADLGWTDDRAQRFAALAGPDLVPGRVALEHNHVFRVLTADGEVLAEVAGALKHRAAARTDLPVVGDWVGVRLDPAGARSQIRLVLPRSTRVSRKAAGRDTVEQVVAANIDTLFVVFGLDKPVNPRAIERYLVVARHSGAEAVVLLNKCDLVPDAAAHVRGVGPHTDGTPVLAVSSKSGEGLDRVEGWLGRGRTIALIGPSGVGKSSIVNRLIGREVLPTGEVREWDRRGRHTSVHRQLVLREQGGVVIDTPGMREVALWDIEAIDDAFTEIAEAAASCRFRDCRHQTEPGCAVKTAVEAGRIDAARYDSYIKLRTEQDAIEQKREERGLIDAKRQSKTHARAFRALLRDRERQRR